MDRRWTRINTAAIGGVIAVVGAFAAAAICQIAAGFHWYDGVIELYFVVLVASPILFLVGATGALLIRAMVPSGALPIPPLHAPTEIVSGAAIRVAQRPAVAWLIAGGLTGYEAARSTRYLGLPAIPGGPVLGSLLLPPIWILAGAAVARRAAQSSRSVRGPVGAAVAAGAVFASMEIALWILRIGPFKYDLRALLLLSTLAGLVAYKRLLDDEDVDAPPSSVATTRRVWMTGGAMAGFTFSGVVLTGITHLYTGAIVLTLIPIFIWAGAVAGRRAAQTVDTVRPALGGVIAVGAAAAVMDLVFSGLGAPRVVSMIAATWMASAAFGVLTYERLR